MLMEKGKQKGLRLKGKGWLQTSWRHLAFKESIIFFALLFAHLDQIIRLLQNFKLLAVINC